MEELIAEADAALKKALRYIENTYSYDPEGGDEEYQDVCNTIDNARLAIRNHRKEGGVS